MIRSAVAARSELNREIRAFFEDAGFVEVETPRLVDAAGTDPHLDPVPASLSINFGRDRRAMSLHTSPEFAMKELLVAGLDRIYQLCHVWRDGEVTDQHHPEFTLLEWYRVGANYDAIMDDVERLVRVVLPVEFDVTIRGHEGVASLAQPFRRVTMRQAWLEACGIDPIETAGDLDALSAMSGVTRWARWDELFFDIMLSHVEPWLIEQGPVFLTQWPTQLAVLARRCAHDSRVAERFELYVRGVELANGFGELTDAAEQRQRFEQDNVARKAMGKPSQPIPERFLAALERGLPDCSGVAIGVDRLLMLRMGVPSISDVLPLA